MRNNLLPLLAVLVILGLVVLAPRPEESGSGPTLPGAASAGQDVATALLELRPLETAEPPGWAIQRGGSDPVKRSLDRLIWGPFSGQLASRDLLQTYEGSLASLVLGRLESLGESDPLLVSKLLPTLGRESEMSPAIVSELNRRALSDNGLVAKTAFRVLQNIATSEALEAALARRHDDDESIRALARSVLCEAAQRGDGEALAWILDDLRENPTTPSSQYVSALATVSWNAEMMEVLRMVHEAADESERIIVFGTLLAQGDEAAEAEFSRLLGSTDPSTRTNALLMAARSKRVLATELWRDAVMLRQRNEILILMSMMDRAIAEGSEHAPLAFELLQLMAYDASHPTQTNALDLLFRHGDAWAVERTRKELLDESGLYLQQTSERILYGAGPLRDEMLAVALERLKMPNNEVDSYILLALIAQLNPVAAADPVIEVLMEKPLATRSGLLPALVALGESGLERLESELGSSRGAGLYVLLASHVRSPSALTHLEALAEREDLDRGLRNMAMDGIVRLASGPREAALRRVADASQDPELRDRAKLLFWNYL